MLNVNIEWTGEAGGKSKLENFKKRVEAGISTNESEVVAAHSMVMGALASSGYMQDLLSTKYLNFENPWWPSDLIRFSTIGGKLYFASGDISNNTLLGMEGMFFNKDVVTSDLYSAVNEAGFGADLGAEKFFDIKCRTAGLVPDAVVVVATVRALKMHGGAPKESLGNEDIGALERGMGNLLRHISNIKEVYRLPLAVALNRFPTDTERETALVAEMCAALGVRAVVSDVWAKGGAGGEELAREVVRLCEEARGDFRFAYDASATIEEKISAVVTKVYRGDGVDFTPEAQRDIARLTRLGFGGLPVCIAKTQYSFSDDPSRLCAPGGFRVTVRKVKVSAGAGFVVVLTGAISAFILKRSYKESGC